MLGKPLKLKFVSTETIFGRYKDIKRRRPDLSKAKLLLGYKPELALEEGFLKVINARKKLKNSQI